MKKSTLLAGLALIAGCGFANAALEEINGLKISNPETNEYQYYRLSNMRSQRLSYLTQEVYGPEGADAEALFTDTGQGRKLPEIRPDGETTATLFTGDNIYAGLTNYNSNWLIAFSDYDKVVDPATRFWYFTKGTKAGSVEIHNAVIDGGLGTRQVSNSMAFSAEADNYYVINVYETLTTDPGFTDVDGESIENYLTDEQLHAAFGLMAENDINGTSGLDVNNFIVASLEFPNPDYVEGEVEEGDDIPETLWYGFAGAKKCWSPIKDAGKKNGIMNNGSLWFVQEATEAEAEAAKVAYAEVIRQSYKDDATKAIQDAYAEVATQLGAFKNLPTLLTDQTSLDALIAQAQNPTVNVDAVVDLASKDKAIADGNTQAQKLLAQASALIGSGAVVTFQQQFAVRDFAAWIEMIDSEDEETMLDIEQTSALGNAYLSAGMESQFQNGEQGWTNGGYPGIGNKLTADADCQWELVPVAGTRYFNLYNKAKNCYIGAFDRQAMFDAAKAYCEENEIEFEGYNVTEDEDGNEVVEQKNLNSFNFSWPTVTEQAKAGNFMLQPCPGVDDQAGLSDPETATIETLGDYPYLAGGADATLEGLYNTDVTNNVRLTAVTVDEEGNEVWNYIHRARKSDQYALLNWSAAANRWYNESNIFKINVLQEGGIQNIEAAPAAKVQGIYDLQGRRVAKANKGLYIINGVKTIVK